jgi:sugar lactone lactonase YvrE
MRRENVGKVLIAVFLLSPALAAFGCGSSSSSKPPPAPTGFTMFVANAGNNSITAYNTADALAAAQPGGYDFTPLITLSNPYGQTFLDPPGQAALSSGGNLWVADSGGNSVIEIPSTSLTQSGEIAPAITIANPAGKNYLLGPHGVAMDAQGDLWVSNYATDTLVEYTAQQLTSNPTQQPFTFAPAVIISNPTGKFDLVGPATIEFDAEGDLWVANLAGNTVVEYGASQLTSSGSPTPQTTIANPTTTPATTYLLAPHGLAFDAAGDLFVVNATFGSSPLVRYSAAQLAGGGTITQAPSAIYTGSAFDVPAYAEFDSAGDLWVSNTGGPTLPGNLVEFSAASLASSGSPTPETVIGNPAGGNYLYQAFGLAFDSAGNLIVTNRGYDFPVIKYSAAQIASSGTPDPAVVLNNPSAVLPAIYNPTSLALDSADDLWVANDPRGAEPGNIAKLDASSIVNSNFNVKPGLVIEDPTGQTLDHPDDIQFDSSGNLWAASSSIVTTPTGDETSSRLVMYSAASLEAGKPAVTVTINVPTGVLIHFRRMHFDGAGNLWLAGDAVENIDGVATPRIPLVVEYTKAQLASSGTPAFTTIILGIGTHPYFYNPVGLGFDAVGDLWVTSEIATATLNHALAVAYLGKNLGSSSTPVASISGPELIALASAFDSDGNMFVATFGRILEYAAANVALVDDGGAIPDAQGAIAGPLSGLDYPSALAIEK